jgi:hypothetical protein
VASVSFTRRAVPTVRAGVGSARKWLAINSNALARADSASPGVQPLSIVFERRALIFPTGNVPDLGLLITDISVAPDHGKTTVNLRIRSNCTVNIGSRQPEVEFGSPVNS